MFFHSDLNRGLARGLLDQAYSSNSTYVETELDAEDAVNITISCRIFRMGLHIGTSFFSLILLTITLLKMCMLNKVVVAAFFCNVKV